MSLVSGVLNFPPATLRDRVGRRLAAVGLAFMVSIFARAEKPIALPKEIEWTWEVRTPDPDPNLPNVLLLGDSISRNYFPEVRKNLAGIANVYLMASSTSVGDPRLEHQIKESAAIEKVRFRLVHFNNGMHGWAYTELQYKAAFPASFAPYEYSLKKGAYSSGLAGLRFDQTR